MAQGRRLVGGGADIFVDVPMAPGSTEDCLHLNIWAPRDAERAAVMVWLQPVGPSSLRLFDGAAFARDGVVFRPRVPPLYRHFAHPALTVKPNEEPLARFQDDDQIAALKWSRTISPAFGGDRRTSRYSGVGECRLASQP
jgi:para-nitrobenzyl esterase